MNRWILFIAGLGGLAVICNAQVNSRDPFWPIGYNGPDKPVEIRPTPTPTPPPITRELTDEELRELARQEAEKIRQSLVRKGTMKTGNKIYAYVQTKWVSKGDNFFVEVLGRKYRLEIIQLTEDNIQLEPHRVKVDSTP